MYHHIFNFLQLRLLTTINVKLLLINIHWINWQAQDYQANIFLALCEIEWVIEF